MKQLIDLLSRPRPLAIFIALASLGALSFAWIAQYGFNYQPCPLCMMQRKPYMAVIAFGLIAAVLAGRKPKTAYLFIALSGLAFLAGAGIAGFHTGVEQGWWKGLESCGDVTMPQHASLDEMRAYLSNRPIIDCRIPGWKFLGLSMTTYNFMLSMVLSDITMIFGARGFRRLPK